MTEYIYALILVIVAVVAIELYKSYHAVNRTELKYRASHGDELANKLYRAAAYGKTLDVLLWFVIILSSAGCILLLCINAPVLLSFVSVVFLLGLAFAWLPKTKPSKLSGHLALLLTPFVAWLLNYLHRPLSRIYSLSEPSLRHNVPSHVYDKKQLTSYIKSQKSKEGSRLNDEELDTAIHSLKLFDKKVSSVMLGWSKVKTVNANDQLGPVLMDELHNASQTFAPVIDSEDTHKVIGILNNKSLDLHDSGNVTDHMDKNVYFLNEEDNLADGLKAVLSTSSPAFVVVDDKENYTGLLTSSNILSKLIDEDSLVSEGYHHSLTEVANKYNKEELLTDDNEFSSISL